MKVFTKDELAQNNGVEERPTYVAVLGKVYDLSTSKRWIKGSHMRRHSAGQDLTTDLQSAPHGPEVLERFTDIGTLIEERPQEFSGLRGTIENFLNSNPFFRRHPHPAMVHVPIAFFMVIPILQIIALATKSYYTEWTAFCCFVIGALGLAPAIATGYFTWWINYEARDSQIIVTKRKLAWLALVVSLVAIYLRIFLVSNPVSIFNGATFVYTTILIILAVAVSTIGFLGGKLTFPYDHH